MTALALLATGIAACWVLYPLSGKFNPGIASPREQFHVDDDSFRERIVILAAFVLAILPATRRRLATVLSRIREQSATARRLTALAVFLLGGPFLYFLGWCGNRIMLPCWHDEGMYRLQSTFLAHGRFFMPAHPLADFFEVPWVFSRPVRAPVYFIGTGMLHVPAVWFHLPYFLIPLLIASVILVLSYLIVTELIDGVSGLLAVFLLISLAVFRWMALIEMSHPAGAMWGLMAIWSWLSWRKSHRIGWVALAGIAAGWHGITRPLDALCVLLPLGLVWLWELRDVNTRAGLASIAVALVMIAPFVTLQLKFDHALTGKYLEAPLDRYNRTYMNARSLGLEHYDADFRPSSPSEQVRDVYWWGNANQIRDFTTVKQAATQWLMTRLPRAFGVGLPSLLLVVFYPLSILGLTDHRRWILWLIFWTFMAGSACFYLFERQYVMAIAPAIIFSVLLGLNVLSRAFPARNILPVFLPVAILFLASYRIYVNEQGAFVDNGDWNVMRWNYSIIPKQAKPPAIVLFRYKVDEYAPLNEPVYNWDVLNPDDAPIIRVHDLGVRNAELFRYYANTQPDRTVWLFDRANKKLTLLGNVRDLAFNRVN